MRKRLNRRLVVILALVLLVGVVLPGGWLLVRRARRPDVRPLLAKAAAQAAAGEADDALVRYRRILRLDPRCDAAYLAIGEILEGQGDLSGAVRHYNTAVQLNSRNRASLERLGSLAERLGAQEPLRTAADRLLGLDSQSGEAHRWKALILGAAKDYDGAIREAKEAARIAPDQVKTLVVLGDLYRAKGDYALGQQVFEDGLKSHPDNVELLLGLGRLHEARKDDAKSLDKAKAAYELAVRTNPDAASPYLCLANLLARQGKLDEADKQLATAVQRNPTDRIVLASYADFLVKTGRFGAARKHLEGALAALPDWAEGRVLLVEALLNLGENAEARKQFDAFGRDARGTLAAKFLEGRLLRVEGKPAEAVARLREAIVRGPRFAEAHFHLGLAYADLGELGSALASFQEAARRDPTSLAAQRQIAVAALALGDHEAVIEAANRILAAEPEDAAARRMLGRALAAKGDPAAAVEQFQQAAKQSKDATPAVLELAAVRLSERKFQEAERLVQSLPAEARGSARVRFFLAQMCVATDQLARAEAELREAFKAAPHDAAPREFLAAIYARRGERDKARALLEEFAKAEPGNVAAQIALARLCQRSGWLPDALEACRKAEALAPADEAVADQTIATLLALKKPDEALAVAKKIRGARPGHLRAALAVPRVLLAQGKAADALPLLAALVTEHPNEAAPADLLGRAYVAQGDLRRGIEQLRRVAEMRPDAVEVCYLLADACFRSGEYLEAIFWSERVLAHRPGVRGAHLIAAMSHAEREDLTRAIAEYLAAEPPDPEPGYYLGLADLYRRDGKHAEAEETLRKAQKRWPKAPVVALALVRHYDAAGRHDQADDLVKRFEADAGKDPSIPVLLGHHYLATGRMAEAEKAYRQAMALDEKSPALRVLFGDFLLSTGRAAEACAAYREARRLGRADAREKVVEALTRGGSLAEAREELESARKEHPSDAGLLVEQARLLLAEAEHEGTGKKLDACRAACQAALRASPTAQEAHVLLAQSYLAEQPRREQPALAALREAARLSRGASSASIQLARLLADLGQPADAERECRRILTLMPGHLPALETLGAAMAKGHPDRPALAVAGDLAKEFPTNPARHLLLGSALASERKWPEAAAEFRACLSEAPTTAQALAGLARTLVAAGEPAKAVAECQAFLERNPNQVAALDLLASTCLANKEPARAAEAWDAASRLAPAEHRFAAAGANARIIAKEPEKAVASCEAYVARWPRDPRGHATLGAVRLAQGNAAEAEKEFAAALQLEPDNANALWLLTGALIQQKRFDEALAACNAFQRTHPNNARVWHTLASVHSAWESFVAAESCLDAALRLDGELLVARFDLGSLHLRGKRYGEAAEQFEKVVAARPRDVAALNNLAWCLAEAGSDLDRAKKLASTGLEASPDAPNLLDTLGWVCCKRKEYDEAAKVLRRSLELRPDSPVSRYHLAVALAAQGKEGEARGELERALAAKKPFSESADAQALLAKLAGTAAPAPK